MVPPVKSYDHFGLYTVCLITLQFIKSPFGGYVLFSTDINNREIFICLCWKLVDFWQVRNGVSTIMNCKVIIVYQFETYFIVFSW